MAMEAAPNKRSYIRLNAMRSLLLGLPRATLCQQFCRTDRMVRLWIDLFNRGGLDAFLVKSNDDELSPRALLLKKEVRAALQPAA